MKLFSKKDKKKKTKSDKIIIKCGKDDVRVYPKAIIPTDKLTREK